MSEHTKRIAAALEVALIPKTVRPRMMLPEQAALLASIIEPAIEAGMREAFHAGKKAADLDWLDDADVAAFWTEVFTVLERA